jgi:HemK-related putative methylase
MGIVSRTWNSLRMLPDRRRLERRLARPVVESVCGQTVVVLPQVFNPVVFRTGACLAAFLRDSIAAEPRGGGVSRALDLGTGSGVLALVLAARGYRVAAVDLNDEAVRCARANALINGLEDRIQVFEGDLYGPLAEGKFDLVVFNPPFFRGEPASRFDLSWRSRDVLPRFAQGLSVRLATGGRAMVIWSSHEPEKTLLEPIEEARLRINVLHRRQLPGEALTIYGIAPGN